MLLGADPEFFVLDSDYSVLNAIKFIKNNKKTPKKINDYKFFYDNIALEVNFTPAKTKDELVSKIDKCFSETKKLLGGNKISLQAHAIVNSIELKDKNAKEINCEPDIDSYKFCYNKLPSNLYNNTNERCIGGHVHIGGFKNDLICDPFMKPLFVYMLDLFLAIPYNLLDNSVASSKRRKTYGKAGSYRCKPYGIEYRVLSPFWLQNDQTVQLLYDICDFVFHEMSDGLYQKFWKLDISKINAKTKNGYECFGYDYKELTKTINDYDYNLCRKYFSFIQNFLPSKITKTINDLCKQRFDPVNFYWNT